MSQNSTAPAFDAADPVALTQALIRCPSVTPAEGGALALLDAVLTAEGFTVDRPVFSAPGMPDVENLYARIGTDGPVLVIAGHTDVVPPGDLAAWTRDPFAATIVDGVLYGRGACDMKGGLAASIIAAEAFVALYPDHPGRIEISATADEETGGFGGVAFLAEQGAFAHVGHVLIPEPLHKDRICLGHRGVWWAEIETHGRIAHGSMPFLGDSAIRHMGAVLEEMERSLFPLLKSKRTEMPVIPEGAKNSTLNINSIHGGEPDLGPGFTGLPAPCVADRCRIVIDRRFLIEEDLTEVKREVTAMLEGIRAERPNFSYEIRDMFEVIPSMTDREAPVVRSTAAAIERVLGREADYVVSPGTYDQKHIDRIGKLKNCIAYGPGVLDLAHQPDEWIGVRDMLDSARVMALVLDDILRDGGRMGDSPNRDAMA